MGAGIAVEFLVAGQDVIISEAGPQAAESALERVRDSLSRTLRRRGREGTDEAVLRSLEITVGPAPVADPELVVEAVPEDPELKIAVLEGAEAAYPRAGVLATNTSSLSISELSRSLAEPARFTGMHFFNPVPVSQLVEIVVGDRTSPETVEATRSLVNLIGKTPIVVRDSPGFASSRLGIALGMEAIRMVEQEVASAEDIDRAMVLGYKHPIGPLKLTDLVGLDVRLAIADYLSEQLGPRFTPPDLLRRMVAEGRLGKKTGEGFYQW